MLEIGISADILEAILTGQKTIEARLRTGKFITVRQGDRISIRKDIWHDDRIISSTPDQAVVTVDRTQYFNDFSSMFAAIDYQLLLPNAASEAEALATYRQFYTTAQELEHGVVAIYFSLQS